MMQEMGEPTLKLWSGKEQKNASTQQGRREENKSRSHTQGVPSLGTMLRLGLCQYLQVQAYARLLERKSF